MKRIIMLVLVAFVMAACGGPKAQGKEAAADPIQGPPAPPTATQMPITETPPAEFRLLEDGSYIMISDRGEELATITWNNVDIITIANDGNEYEKKLDEGYIAIAFLLFKKGEPVATGAIEIFIHNGELYYKIPEVTPNK